MVFKVRVIGTASDGRMDCTITTTSLERVRQLKRFSARNKYQISIEMIDD